MLEGAGGSVKKGLRLARGGVGSCSDSGMGQLARSKSYSFHSRVSQSSSLSARFPWIRRTAIDTMELTVSTVSLGHSAWWSFCGVVSVTMHSRRASQPLTCGAGAETRCAVWPSEPDGARAGLRWWGPGK